MSEAIRRGIKRSVFIINHEKSIWLPRQEGQLLGFIIDLKEGTFKVPNHRVENLKILLDKVTEKKCYTTAREVAKVTGSIISVSLALGPVARLWTRALYRNSSSATTWDRKIILSIEGQKGIEFWAEEFDSCHGVLIWKRAPKIDVITYSDAGGPDWGLLCAGGWDNCERTVVKKTKREKFNLERSHGNLPCSSSIYQTLTGENYKTLY